MCAPPHNSVERINLADGNPIPVENNTIYSGTLIDSKANASLEIKKRIRTTRATWVKMSMFWKHSHLPVKKKLQIYNAVIRAKLVYGLETVAPTKSDCKLYGLFSLRALSKYYA